MAIGPLNTARTCLILLLIACPAVLAAAGSARASKHLWPLAAIHFDEPAPETSTFAMTENEFWSRRSALELRIVRAYDELTASLPYEQRLVLTAAQSRWRNCLALYEQALRTRLDEPVKVFYGVKGQERKTNVYKDTIFAMLEHRAQDLERWCEGCYGHPHGGAPGNARPGLASAASALDEAFGVNIYIMDEVFRVPTQAAQSAWQSFVRSDIEFVRAATANDEVAVNAEGLMRAERMLGLTLLQREGYVFFHRERED